MSEVSAPTPVPVRGVTPMDVAAAVIRQAGRVMICQRMEGDSGGGLWEFPGGKREDGESLEQCVVREIREELGCEVRVGQLIAAIPAEWKGKALLLHFFDAVITSGVPTPIEVARIEWVEPSRLSDFEFLPSNKPLIGQLSPEPRSTP